MNKKIRERLKQRKRRRDMRIDKTYLPPSPAIRCSGIQFELAERQQAIASGGIGAILQVANQLDLRTHINKSIPLFKLYLPYDEADHVLNIALNLLAGGTCLDHLELRRTDEAYLNALNAQRIPDPTTAGDFCRRFDEITILQLMQGFNQVRRKVWAQQPEEFFERAIIEADGTMVETSGRCKQGIGMNYKKQWGYHPLVVTLANTGEPLYIANRSGNRPSHENASVFFDLAIDQCNAAGFKKILLRGDTDFSLTEHFDQWTDQGVGFVFGYDAKKNLVDIADALEKDQWKPLKRRHPPAQGILESAIEQPRATFEGKYLHTFPFEMAAAYLFHIVKNHPFVDGNKRTGTVSALVFLDWNDCRITTKPGEVDEPGSWKLDYARISHFEPCQLLSKSAR